MYKLHKMNHRAYKGDNHQYRRHAKSVRTPAVTALLAVVLVCLAACSVGGEHYTLFAYDLDGYVQSATAISSDITLNKHGAGYITINGETGSMQWTDDGGVFTLTSGEDSLTGTIADGIITLYIDEDAAWYYAAEGADTSSVPVLSAQEYMDILRGQP